MISAALWKSIRSTLLSVCCLSLITSEKIGPIDLINVLKVNLLDKGVRNLGDCISELTGKKVGTAIKKPQCFTLEFIKCLS